MPTRAFSEIITVQTKTQITFVNLYGGFINLKWVLVKYLTKAWEYTLFL